MNMSKTSTLLLTLVLISELSVLGARAARSNPNPNPNLNPNPNPDPNPSSEGPAGPDGGDPFFGPGGAGFGIPGLDMPWGQGISGGYGYGYGYSGPKGGYGYSGSGTIRPSVVCSDKGPCYLKKLTCPAKCFSSFSRSGQGYGAGGGGGGCTMDCKYKCIAYC